MARWVMKWSAAAVGHEVVRGCAVPMPFPGWRVDRLAGANLDDLTASGLYQPATVEDVEGLAVEVSMPGGVRPGREPDAHQTLGT